MLSRGFLDLSTPVKLFLLLTLALAPLAFVALLAAREADRTRDLLLQTAASNTATHLAGALGSAIHAEQGALKRMIDALQDGTYRMDRLCRVLEARSGDIAYGPVVSGASFRGRDCGAPDPGSTSAPLTLAQDALVTRIERDGVSIHTALPPASLRGLLATPGLDGKVAVDLRTPDRILPVTSLPANGRAVIEKTVGIGSGIDLRLRVVREADTPTETILAWLPLIMFLAASTLAVVVASLLLIYPLKRLTETIGLLEDDRIPAIPDATTPAREINHLTERLQHYTRAVRHHEAEQQRSLEAQRKLVREIHHRVKNNLQVVSSLIRMQMRDAAAMTSEEALNVVQRRVDALSIVHRNHLSDGSTGAMIPLRIMLSELAAALRSSYAEQRIAIDLNVDERIAVSQDVAVPLAFFLTDCVEIAAAGRRQGQFVIGAKPVGDGNSGQLHFLAEEIGARIEELGPAAQRRRVLDGFARQLRSTLDIVSPDSVAVSFLCRLDEDVEPLAAGAV